jgi:hypothetical protein
MEPEGLLMSSHEPVIWPYIKSVKFFPHFQILLFKIHLNISFPAQQLDLPNGHLS